MHRVSDPTPYDDFDRSAWRELRASTPLPLAAEELTALRGLGETLDLTEVEEVYLPLSRLLNLHVTAAHELHTATARFLGETGPRDRGVPFVIGIAGSVAVGKSTTARLLRALLARWPDHPHVELVTTDGFLLPNAELERRGVMNRKGFPESYDQRGLLRFLSAVKSGVAEVAAPVYSHLSYDVVPGETVVVHRPDVLIVEGLNVLQPARPQPEGRPRMAVSDYFDFSVYVDAAVQHVADWYVERFLALQRTSFADPASYFHRYAALDQDEARRTAREIWAQVNQPNLEENILPTRGRATLILQKGADHAVRRVRLRKL